MTGDGATKSLRLLALGAVMMLGVGGVGLSAGATTPPQGSAEMGHASQQSGGNFWLADSAGAVWNFGDTQSFGSAANVPLAHPIVGITPTNDDGGYWLVASDGGIFDYGDAPFEGSTGGIALVKPIVGLTPTNDDRGYWLVASDGGIFAFGDAAFYGSTGGIRLNQPIVGMVSTPSGHGYWLVASDGGIFSFGDAAIRGIDRCHPPQPARHGHDHHAQTGWATGSSPATAGSSISGTPSSTARRVAIPVRIRRRSWSPPRSVPATGSWTRTERRIPSGAWVVCRPPRVSCSDR